MSKGLKKFKFKTKDGVTLSIIAKDQTAALARMGQLVNTVSDWPILQIYRQK
jgi:hypothetical protein